MAIHAARHHGCRVTTTTISQEQHDFALERVEGEGLADRVTVLLEDYRDLRGTYSKLVSLEMIEAVGWQFFGTYFRRCSELLDPDGLMLLQAITIDDRAYEVEKASKSFINTHIFPGGCLPSLDTIHRCVGRHTDLRTVWLDDITEHYAETLVRWRESFEASSKLAAELGYDLPLQADVEAVPGLRRGGLQRAADRRRADAAGQAGVARAAGAVVLVSSAARG